MIIFTWWKEEEDDTAHAAIEADGRRITVHDSEQNEVNPSKDIFGIFRKFKDNYVTLLWM